MPFVTIDGQALHYIDQGTGPAVLLAGSYLWDQGMLGHWLPVCAGARGRAYFRSGKFRVLHRCFAGIPGCENLVKPLEIPAMEYATVGDSQVQSGGGTGRGQPRGCGEPGSTESILCTLARYKLFDANRVICATVG